MYDDLDKREVLIELIESQTQYIVAKHMLKDFSGGVYVSFLLSGHYRLAIKPLDVEYDALLMGIFFDPPSENSIKPKSIMDIINSPE